MIMACGWLRIFVVSLMHVACVCGHSCVLFTQGGFFCEEALLHDDRVAAWTAIAGDWAELLFLLGADFLALCDHFPELKQRLLFHEKGKAKGKKATDVMSMHEEKLRLRQQQRRGGEIFVPGQRMPVGEATRRRSVAQSVSVAQGVVGAMTANLSRGGTATHSAESKSTSLEA